MRNAVNNPSFIGFEELKNLDWSKEIKHPAVISKYGFPTTREYLTKKDKTEFIAFKLLTDEATNELKLLGFCEYNPSKDLYGHFYLSTMEMTLQDMMEELALIIDDSMDSGKGLVIWNTFDTTRFLNLFYNASGYTTEQRLESMQRFTKGVTGSFDKETSTWINEPIVRMNVNYKGSEIGITKQTANTLTFFLRTQTMKRPKEITLYCAQNFYQDDLETSSKEFLSWEYQKEINDNAIDWDLFKDGFDRGNHSEYVEQVLKDNSNDTKATKNLMEKVEDLFYSIFKTYPRSLYTPGSLTKTALSILLEETEQNDLNFYAQLENWQETGHDTDTLRRAYNMLIDSYSAGQIDVHKQGSFINLANADITGAYPSVMTILPDLKNSKVYSSKKECNWSDVPKPSANKIVIVTAEVEILEETVSTLTIKGEAGKGKNKYRENMRRAGNMIVTDVYQAFDLVIKQQSEGSVSRVLEYVVFDCEKKQNPYAKVIQKLWNKRKQLLKNNDPAQLLAKTINNSLYGVTFEGYAQYEEIGDEIEYTGIRTGGYFNPFYAVLITSFTRIRLAEARLEVEKNGGETIQELTDALYWKGTPDMLPENFPSVLDMYFKSNGWRQQKTLGFFEEPKALKNGLFLTVGMYSYLDPKTNEYTVKTMGYKHDRDAGRDTLREKLEISSWAREWFRNKRKGNVRPGSEQDLLLKEIVYQGFNEDDFADDKDLTQVPFKKEKNMLTPSEIAQAEGGISPNLLGMEQAKTDHL